MSWWSDLGGFISDSASKVFDSDIFSTQNILSGLGAFSTVWSQREAQEQANDLAKSKFDQQIALDNLSHQRAIELLKLKAALGGGGGGGGGGGPDYEAIERLRAMMQAKELQTNQASQGSANTVQALQNLILAGQRPIIR